MRLTNRPELFNGAAALTPRRDGRPQVVAQEELGVLLASVACFGSLGHEAKAIAMA